MRSETIIFEGEIDKQSGDVETIFSIADSFGFVYFVSEGGHETLSVGITKQQARKFAKQILEMTGDEDGNG